MTNKMPVVGQRYRRFGGYYEVEVIAIYRGKKVVYDNPNFDYPSYGDFLDFFESFEELPTTLQKTEEVQVKENIIAEEGDWHIPRVDLKTFTLGIETKEGELVKCTHMPATPEFNKWFKDKFKCCPITGEDLSKVNETPLPVDLEKGEVNGRTMVGEHNMKVDAYYTGDLVCQNGKLTTTNSREVNEVERALEELKNILMKATLSNAYYHEQYKEMKELAQNLVEALEAEKANSKLQASEPADNKIEENLLHGLNSLKWKDAGRDFYSSGYYAKKRQEETLRTIPVCYYCKICDSLIGREEEVTIKKDKKYYCSFSCLGKDEPKSIWKDVSELPKLDESLIVFIDENAKFMRYNFCRQFVDLSNHYHGAGGVKKYCTLTDFINQHEQMRKDIEDLKGRK